MHLVPSIPIPMSIPSIKDVLAARDWLVQAAQSIYDGWEQDGDGFDCELGSGGICHLIAEAITEKLVDLGVEEVVSVHSTIGENHVFVVALLADGVVEIDIPPGIYESGGEYVWKKRPGVVFEPGHILVSRLEGPMSAEEFRERFDAF